MNYKVKNNDTGNWMTYRKDNCGHYSVVREGLPRISGVSLYSYPEYINRYETVIRRDRSYKPDLEVFDVWNRCDMDYKFTEIETKTTKTRRDVYGNKYRQYVHKGRPISTLKTELYLNY